MGKLNISIIKAFGDGLANSIIVHLIECSKQMKSDCINTGELLERNENIISNNLVEKYLIAGSNDIRYILETQETFNDKTGRHLGRADIRVFSCNHFAIDARAYFIVECKRIDGGSASRESYVADGVSRFFVPATSPKYPSYYKRNIMFGYVEKAIDIPCNANKIDKLQSSLLDGLTIEPFSLIQKEDSQHYVYTCKYTSQHVGNVELSHLFFNFAGAICSK